MCKVNLLYPREIHSEKSNTHALLSYGVADVQKEIIVTFHAQEYITPRNNTNQLTYQNMWCSAPFHKRGVTVRKNRDAISVIIVLINLL